MSKYCRIPRAVGPLVLLLEPNWMTPYTIKHKEKLLVKNTKCIAPGGFYVFQGQSLAKITRKVLKLTFP